MSNEDQLKMLHAGRHVSLVARGRWEFATRNLKRPAVGVVALTESGHVVLVEQYRPPVGRAVVEIPAGLSGDVPGAEEEPLLQAAQRELLEETGYAARRWTELGSGYSSPGITDESITLYLAEGLIKQGPGGGDEHEQITIHEVALEEVSQWLSARQAMADLKLFAGLLLAQSHLRRR